jgi:hypothetical protein
MEGLGRYLESSQLADVEVEADGRVFPAHRIVLARHSLLLRQIFEDAPEELLPLRLVVVCSPGTPCSAVVKEEKEGAGKVEVVLPPGAWPLVASFMYEGWVLLHPNNVLPLFDCAVRLKVRPPPPPPPPFSRKRRVTHLMRVRVRCAVCVIRSLACMRSARGSSRPARETSWDWPRRLVSGTSLPLKVRAARTHAHTHTRAHVASLATLD